MYKEIAIQTGQWLENNFREFLKSDERPQIEGRSSYWNKDETVLHASVVSKCPKRNAAKMAGVIEDTFDDFSLLRMAQGSTMGHFVAQYAYWLQEKQNDAALKGEVPTLYVDHEHSLFNAEEYIAGSADIMLGFNAQNAVSEHEYFPVEVKLTDAWKYGGLTLDQFVQTCVYIRLKNKEAFSWCNTGYIFTIYDKREAGNHWKIWTVYHDNKENGFVLIADNELKQMNGFPADERGCVFLPDTTLDQWIEAHHTWMRMFKEEIDPIDLPAPLVTPDNWECASIKQPEFRKTAWRDPETDEKHPAGSLKKNTGIVHINCQLFYACWPDFVKAWGVEPTPNMPRKLQMNIVGNQNESGTE